MTPDEKHAHARSFPIHVGVDTAKTFHVLVAQGPDGQRSKPFRVEVSRAGFAATDARQRRHSSGHTPAQILFPMERATVSVAILTAMSRPSTSQAEGQGRLRDEVTAGISPLHPGRL